MLLSNKKRHSVFYVQSPQDRRLVQDSTDSNGDEVRKLKFLLAQQLDTINSLVKEVSEWEKTARIKEGENEELRRQVAELRELYFVSLGRSIKLQGMQLGWTQGSVMNQLYEEALAKKVDFKEWPQWLTTMIEPSAGAPSHNARESLARLSTEPSSMSSGDNETPNIIGETSHLLQTPSSSQPKVLLLKDKDSTDISDITDTENDTDNEFESEEGSEVDELTKDSACAMPWAEYVGHEEYMVKDTYFSWREMNILYGLLAGGLPSISRDQMRDLLSGATSENPYLRAASHIMDADAKHHQLARSGEMNVVVVTQQGVASPVIDLLMYATDRSQDGYVCTQSFIHMLSIISRGTQEEKQSLMFKLCDVNGDGLVCKLDLLLVVQEIHALLPRYAYTSANVEGVLEEMFGPNAAADCAIDRKTFVMAAKTLPDMTRGFGLFDHLFYTLVRPVILAEAHIRGPSSLPEWSLGILLIRRKIGGLIPGPLIPRWYEVRDGFLIGYKRLKRDDPHEVLCLLHASVHAVASTTAAGGVSSAGSGKHATFILKIGSRDGEIAREFTAKTGRQASDWVNAIRANAIGGYRYHSFAPIRSQVNSKWYVNAADYYGDLALHLSRAQNEIFIAGWWLTPMVYLRRSEWPLNAQHRLDNILLERAKAGVSVYILIWEETTFSLQLGSKFTQDYLEGIHPNIRVLRHPRFTPLVWSNHQKSVIIDQSLAFLGGIDLCYGRYDDEKFSVVDMDEKMYPGLDYGNVCLGVPCKNDGEFSATMLDRTKQARMPWHDIQCRVDGKAARDASFNFIQRWNHARDDYRTYPLLVPSVQSSAMATAVPVPDLDSDSADTHSRCEVQVVRSVSEWSAGQPIEDSIYQAYMDLIANAKHYIFIQNQYFISSVEGSQPKNKIAKAIVQRIRQAIINNETFRVIILLPIHSEGALYDKTTCILVLWTMRTINAIINALKGEFPEVDLDDYLTFCSLRNWGVAGKHIFTEQVYVHAKLMIVDDRAAIIGSANLNDRSLRGSRDSEIAVVIRDTEFVDSVMDGLPYQAGQFAHSLRMRLWKVHLGLRQIDEEILQGGRRRPSMFAMGDQGRSMKRSESEEFKFRADNKAYKAIMDPVADSSYHDVWRGHAKSNSDLYREVFSYRIPENCSKLAQLRRGSILPISQSPPNSDLSTMQNASAAASIPEEMEVSPHGAVLELDEDEQDSNGRAKKNSRVGTLKKIKGYLVEYPIQMLNEEELAPAVLSREWFLDQKIFL